MSYVVKAMCYLDKNGHGVPTSEAAQDYDDYELAELAASAAGGFVVKVEDGRIISESAKITPQKKKKRQKRIKRGCQNNKGKKHDENSLVSMDRAILKHLRLCSVFEKEIR